MRRSSLALCALSLLGPSVAWAQPDNSARAQTLFEQGVAASRANDYANACPKFAASQKLDPKTSTLLNLANCYELNGQTASAWASFKEAEAAARKYGRTDWADRAAAATVRLEPKLVRLTIHLPDALRKARPVVELDGAALQATEWEQPFPVDPGSHRLDWSAPDFKPATRTIDVTTTSVVIELTALEPAPRRVDAAPPGTRDLAPSMWTTGRVAGVVASGIGVASLVTGSVFAVLADSKYEEAEDLCGAPSGSPRICQPGDASRDALAARDDAETRATIATSLFIAGGALAAGGVALFLLSPEPRGRRVAIVPWNAGLAATGTW